MGLSDLPLTRRDLTVLPAAAAAAVTTAGAAGAAGSTAPSQAPRPRPPSVGRRHRLREEAGPVEALDLPLDTLRGTARRDGGTRTPVIETTRFTVVGVTWRRGRGRVRARWRRQRGGWTEWRELPALHHGPDPDTEEAQAVTSATDLTWVAPSDALQLELVGDQRDAVLALLHPRRRPEDEVADRRATRVARDTPGSVPRPRLLGRKAWGADGSLRNGRPTYNRRIRQVHIHHTVNSNGYSRADVPAMIRAMYRYHTRSLGWSDLGYNFLVDRFGRIWIGRAGGPNRAVRGAHTLGFNHASVGVAVIGNFETGRPTPRIRRAITRVASWKLDLYDGRPRRWIWIRSAGSDKFREGELVRLPTIDGHRHTNETACPGVRLFWALPDIRERTARRMARFRT